MDFRQANQFLENVIDALKYGGEIEYTFEDVNEVPSRPVMHKKKGGPKNPSPTRHTAPKEPPEPMVVWEPPWEDQSDPTHFKFKSIAPHVQAQGKKKWIKVRPSKYDKPGSRLTFRSLLQSRLQKRQEAMDTDKPRDKEFAHSHRNPYAKLAKQRKGGSMRDRRERRPKDARRKRAEFDY